MEKTVVIKTGGSMHVPSIMAMIGRLVSEAQCVISVSIASNKETIDISSEPMNRRLLDRIVKQAERYRERICQPA